MSNKSIQSEHRDIKEKISDETLKQIELSPDPFTALDLLTNHESMTICAILDKLSPISGALLFGIIKMRAKNLTNEYNVDFYQYIINRCEELELNVVKGCLFARNETYRLTGVLLI